MDKDNEILNISLTKTLKRLSTSREDDGTRIVKKSRIEEEKIDGILNLNVTSVSKWNTVVTTKTVNIAMFDWEFSAVPHTIDDAKYIEVSLICNSNSESTLWSCKADVEFRLVSNHNGGQDIVYHSHKFVHHFNYKNRRHEVLKFIGWESLMCAELGYVRNDQLRIEAHLSIGSIVGLYNSQQFNFLTEAGDSSDVTLIVEGSAIHISKAYLSLYSRFFNAMFRSSFNENDKKEIELKDVSLQEFMELLKVIYPTHSPITVKTVDAMLKLGDRFDIRYVMQACQTFLLETNAVTNYKKMVYADQYYLSKLQENCLSKITDKTMLKHLKNSPEYSEFSDITRLAILNKAFAIFYPNNSENMEDSQ